jgi:hypothetical protein
MTDRFVPSDNVLTVEDDHKSTITITTTNMMIATFMTIADEIILEIEDPFTTIMTLVGRK